MTGSATPPPPAGPGDTTVSLRIPDRLNAAELFVDRHAAAGNGDRIAIHYAGDGSSWSYERVRRHVNRVGNALRRLGVEPEQRVALLLPDGPDFVGAFFGAIKIGAVPVPLNTLLRPADYEVLLRDSRARALVAAAPLLGQIEPIRGRLRHLRHLLVAAGPAGETPELPPAALGHAVHAMPDLLEASSDELDPEPLSKDDVCFWLYTSGTTGTPKAAVHLQHDMLVCAETYARHVLRIGPGDRTYSVARLFFAYGLGNALYFPFHVGATTVLSPARPEPRVVFELVERYRPTLLFSVPTSYAALLAYADAPPRAALASVRLCVSAGEALPPALYERWLERYGVEILDGIGSTEVLQMFISNRAGAVRPGSSGQVVPGYQARLVGEDGGEVEVGEVGDLWIRGDSTCAYYWNRHEQTKATICGEWIRTGDKYRRDRDGYYFYQGRSDDMLKVGGVWVSPFEVEATLLEHEAVREAAVVGARDAEGLVKPKAFVVVRDGVIADDGLAARLQRHVKERLAPYKYPRWIEFVAALPKTATGKIQRYKLR